jgi:hypothetical protein
VSAEATPAPAYFKKPSNAVTMPRTRAQAKIVVACSPCEAEAPLFHLPVETRLQIYEFVLLADFYGGNKGRAPDKPDVGVDNDAASEERDNGSSSLNYDRFENLVPYTQQPTYENRQAYGQLLLACKMIHAEAAPLFYSKVIFFIKESFKFANMFLRRLPAYKITWIRHLELRLSWSDFRCVNGNYRSKVLSDLITVFKTYRELSHLDSLTLTIHGRLLYDEFNQQLVVFRPFETSHEFHFTSEKIISCMWEAGRTLANTIAIAGLDISEHVEDVVEKNTAVGNFIPRSAVTRVKVQRKE